MKESIITCKGLTLVQSFNNSQHECKNIGRLLQSNDCLRTEIMEVILDILISITYLLNMNNDCSQNDQYIFYIVI